jgi:hypothetical protein
VDLFSVIQYLLFIVIVTALVKPLGRYMERVFSRKRTVLDRLFLPIERIIYRITRVDPDVEMSGKECATCFLLFGFVGTILRYGILRVQQFLPWFFPRYHTTPLSPELNCVGARGGTEENDRDDSHCRNASKRRTSISQALKPESELVCGTLGEVGQRRMSVEADPIWRIVLAASVAAIHRTLPRGAQPSGQRRILFPSRPEAGRNIGAVRCRERLGGLLKYYEREAV